MSNWFAPSLTIPEDARAEIKAWVDEQEWPEGTKLKDPETYHITILYSPDSYGTVAAERLMDKWAPENWSHSVRVIGVDEFSSGDDSAWRPVVLELTGLLLRIDAEEVLKDAESIGMKVSRFEGGYRPHITVAFLPPEASTPRYSRLPGAHAEVGFPLKFETEPTLRDLHAVYDECKRREDG